MDSGVVGRLEDERFLRGVGRFAENIPAAGMLHAVFVRAAIAHGELGDIDVGVALGVPGVVAVFTGADLDVAGVGVLPAVASVQSIDGSSSIDPPRPALAVGRVRHVGEAVALVVAASPEAALDGAEAVRVAYRPLPSAVSPDEALADGAPSLWPNGNLCFDWQKGDGTAVDEAIRRAARVVTLRAGCGRVCPSPLETRAAIGSYDAATDVITLVTPSQGAHLIRDLLCEHVLRIPQGRLRVVTEDVGGGFGMKFYLYPEHAVIAWAARRLGRTVRWIGSRRESFLSDTQAREQTATCTLALDAQGRFTALRVDGVANLGAYLSTYAAMIPSEGAAKVASGPYRIPAIHMRVKGVFTNTVPVDAYRGAGKPEMAYTLERLVDVAARQIGLDPLELRRRNLIPAAAMPYRTPLGIAYDSGDYRAALDLAESKSDRAGFAARREDSRARGRLRGYGMASYLHVTGGFARERARIRVDGDTVHAFTGTQSNGHGHETSFAQIVAKALEVPLACVRVYQGDTGAIPTGGGTGGSSSSIISANTLTGAAVETIARARLLASHILEAAAQDIVYAKGALSIVGTDRCISLFELAARAPGDPRLPPDLLGPLEGASDFAHTVVSSPYGVMTCEVELDPETGQVHPVRIVSVQDIGPVINQVLVDGQVHGGIAQGLGQALTERMVYAQSGEPLTLSYADYATPHADEMPLIDSITLETPSPNNALGLKGVGEVCTIGAPAAAMNAVVDAVAELGVEHIDMPATPERIVAAIRRAGIRGP
jgi:carbon-monoxide dehydrogenase large subunit